MQSNGQRHMFTAALVQNNITIIWVPEYSKRWYVHASTTQYLKLSSLDREQLQDGPAKTETRYMINRGVIDEWSTSDLNPI